MNKLLVICGPTATGKTVLAAHLAKELNGELISADSRQVYRGMDITTGKGRPDARVWLYDVVDPDEQFSVSHWVELARAAITDIQKRGKLPIVVGGTGLYIQALLNPFSSIDVPPDDALRTELKKLSVSELQHMLKRQDMNDSDWQNPRRLIRKIEIARTKIIHNGRGEAFDAFLIGLTAPLPILYKRIDERLQERVRAGLETEIAALRGRYNSDLPSMSAIGVNEHAYARRQMTWFKKQKGIHWFNCMSPTLFADVLYLIRHVPKD